MPSSPARVTYLAASAELDDGPVQDARIDLDGDGRIIRAGTQQALASIPAAPLIRDLGASLLLPGLVNAHSHAFQRAIRGATHSRGPHEASSFWSWREAMYRVAQSLNPDQLQHITEVAFREMLRAGITCVGEFHYVHHQVDGTPYDNPNELSLRVVEAARNVGIRLVLLEVYYARSGANGEPLPEQRRFCDGSVDAYLTRVQSLLHQGVSVGIAPHSVRAVGRQDLEALAGFATEHGLPFHIHVSEQLRENEECQQEHGMSPIQLLQDVGATTPDSLLTAVHAVHIDNEDREILSGHCVCACPTTEADLGDGVVEASKLIRNDTTLALGSDSNAVVDLVQEARLLEMHERLVLQSRLRLNDDDGHLGRSLLKIASQGGAKSLGRGRTGLSAGCPMDAAVVDLRHPFFAEVRTGSTLNALLAAGTSAPIHNVIVDGIELGRA